MTESVGKRAAKGVVWSAIERFSVQGIQFILSIVIARLVAPAEYGLIAMLSIFLAIAQTFIDSGFSNALIQKQDRSETDFSTVFYFNTVVAFLVYGILYVTAPWIAAFYKEPLLNTITKWVGLNIIISGFSIVQRAKLTIKLDFKTQAKASLIAVVVSGALGIGLAYKGYGVWALVVQSLSNNFLNTLFLWFFAKWWPKLLFSWASFRILFSFGSKLLLGALLHTIYINLYTLVIGKKFSAESAGYYNNASRITSFPSQQLSTVFSRAVYPLQCELQNDDEKLTSVTFAYLRFLCFIIFPLMTGLAVLAEPLVKVILGNKWLPSVPFIQILAIANILYPISYINWQLLNIKGRTDLSLKSEIAKKITGFCILFFTLPFGLQYISFGLILYSVADVLIIIFFVKKVLTISYWKQLKLLLPILLLSIVMGGVIYLFVSFSFSSTKKLILGSIVGALVYFLCAIIFRFREIPVIFKYILKQ